MKNGKNKNTIKKFNNVNMEKINVFYKKSILKTILRMLTMEHDGYRTVKAVKNINMLFTNISEDTYKNHKESAAIIWCIKYTSKQWLDGIVNIELVYEGAKRTDEFDNIKDEVFSNSMNDINVVSPPEAKMVLNLISEALQYGCITSLKDEYIELLDDVNLDHPGAFRDVVDRLFLISESLVDIKHNTNLVANRLTFNTGDIDSIKESVAQTINSLQSSNNIFKTGIKRLNTLLSPGFMNGRLYIYLGLPAAGKSIMLLKNALDIRKYNPNYIPKTPNMKPCVLYITMENTFTETIERVWNMSFDDSITNYSIEEALEKLSGELGLLTTDNDVDDNSLLGQLSSDDKNKHSNIEIVMKYFSYREISTDDILTIIQDLKDENFEVCALVLDYIKRIKPSVPVPDNVKLELNRVVNELKAISVITDIPVITAHQMNRVGASKVDDAAKAGKGDVIKNAGRENVGDALIVINYIKLIPAHIKLLELRERQSTINY